MKRSAAAFFAILAAAGSAQAGELAPMQGKSISLGSVNGVAYYTVGKDGYQVVTTLAAGENGTPMRFVATLAKGQRLVLSAPRAADEAPMELEIARMGDTLLVSDPAAITN